MCSSDLIMARRLFIAFSGQYFLKNLRELGFKTFDGIIDESYDAEEDDFKRMTMIVEETKRLCFLNQSQLDNFLKEAREIVEYNYSVLMNRKEFIRKL